MSLFSKNQINGFWVVILFVIFSVNCLPQSFNDCGRLQLRRSAIIEQWYKKSTRSTWVDFVKQHEDEHQIKTKNKLAYPFISFIFPVFDRSFALKDPIETLYSQQLPFSFEVIALDNYSCDNTVALLENYAKKHPNFFVYKLDKHKKLSTVLNEGIAYARGTYVCPFSAEKIIGSSVASMIAEMEQNRLDVAIPRTIQFFDNFQIHDIKKQLYLFQHKQTLTIEELLDDTQALLLDRSTCIFTKKCWQSVGGIPNENRIPFWSFLFELASQAYEIRILDGTCRYRLWSPQDNIIPLWDYDYDYGHEKKPKVKNIYQVLARHQELFCVHPNSIINVTTDKKNNNVTTILKAAKELLLPDSLKNPLMQARQYKRTLKFEQAIKCYEKVTREHLTSPIIRLELADTLYALGNYNYEHANICLESLSPTMVMELQ